MTLSIGSSPFFERNPLLSCKQQEFTTFAALCAAWSMVSICVPKGSSGLPLWARRMNGGGRYRRLHATKSPESSETIRRASSPPAGDSMKIWSDLHGDMQNQAEMSWSPAQ